MSHAQWAPARKSAKKYPAELSQPHVPGVTKGLKQCGGRDVEHGEQEDITKEWTASATRLRAEPEGKNSLTPPGLWKNKMG